MDIKSRKGDISIKGLAVTVAAIVIVGFVMVWIMNTGFDVVWNQIWEWITGIFDSSAVHP